MNHAQPGILAAVPRAARYLVFCLRPDADPRPALARLAAVVDGERTVVGLGRSLVLALGARVEGLHGFPLVGGRGIEVPSTPAALWLWLRGDDHGELLSRGRELEQGLAPAFRLEQAIDAFRYGSGRDLTGYEDGTENPEGDDAVKTAIVSVGEADLDGSSFVAVQQWLHDLDHFGSMQPSSQDLAIGRRISDNQEIEDAPTSAHVKRTAQEDFDPEAFVLRRSMPWSCGRDAGLVFTAFGHSFDAFEALLRRMVGEEDGTTDALFQFTRPLTGSYFWCPPLRDGRLDLRRIDIGA